MSAANARKAYLITPTPGAGYSNTNRASLATAANIVDELSNPS